MCSRLLAASALLLVSQTLSAASPEITKHIDRAWFQRALASETAHGREAAFRPNGFFMVSLDRQWRPTGNPNGRLVSQSRQIFAMMGAGYAAAGEATYVDAMRGWNATIPK